MVAVPRMPTGAASRSPASSAYNRSVSVEFGCKDLLDLKYVSPAQAQEEPVADQQAQLGGRAA